MGHISEKEKKKELLLKKKRTKIPLMVRCYLLRDGRHTVCY